MSIFEGYPSFVTGLKELQKQIWIGLKLVPAFLFLEIRALDFDQRLRAQLQMGAFVDRGYEHRFDHVSRIEVGAEEGFADFL